MTRGMQQLLRARPATLTETAKVEKEICAAHRRSRDGCGLGRYAPPWESRHRSEEIVPVPDRPDRRPGGQRLLAAMIALSFRLTVNRATTPRHSAFDGALARSFTRHDRGVADARDRSEPR